MSHPKRHSPTPRDGAQAILDAAATLFADQGYDAVSINVIAHAAGVSKANVFHHFGNKKALYLEVLRAACQNDSTRMLQQLGEPDGPVSDYLRQYARLHLRSLLQNERSSRLIQSEVTRGGNIDGAELAAQLFSDNYSRLLAIVESGQRRGELRNDLSPALLVVTLVAANVFFFEAHKILEHLPGTDFVGDPQGYTDQVLDLLLRGGTALPPG